MKMRKFYIPCPDVILLKKHVLIMSLIGGDSKPAPKLKDANLTQEQLKIAYEHCIQVKLITSKMSFNQILNVN